MTTQPKEKKQDWREDLYRLDIGDPNSKGCTITLGEYLGIDCPELENFISALLEQTREETIEECIEALPKKDYNFGKPHKDEFIDCTCGYGYDDCVCSENEKIEECITSLQLLKNKK